MSKRPIKIVITTGDIDGIGLEVTAKALHSLGPQSGVQFIYFVSHHGDSLPLKALHRKFKVIQFSSWPEAIGYRPKSKREILQVNSATSPAKWVEMAAVACLHRRADAIVTGPLSKPEILRSGMNDIGHTDILKRVFGGQSAWMCFLGKKFNVTLVSGHLPLHGVESALTPELIEKSLRAFLSHFCSGKRRRPLGVLGLNPHAGDSSLLGTFEKDVLIPTLNRLRDEGHFLDGPLVPDAAFLRSNWKKYEAYVAMYHDQGLVPFKLVHGYESGTHITLGLPVIRTSVDHGTAKDIFGQNKADHRSMLLALKTALQHCKRKKESSYV